MRKVIAIIAALLVLGPLGQMDYEDAVAQHADCLDMVERGFWPAEVCE